MKIKHLQEARETYWEHFCFAWSVAFVLMVHGLFPWMWEWKATEMMEKREVQRFGKFRKR